MSYIECVDGTKYFPKHQDERIGRLELLARWIDEHGGRRPKTLDDIADVSYMPAKMRETNPYSYWGSIEEAAKKAGEHKLTGDEKYASKYEKREDIADSLVKESVDNHYSDTEISWINEGSIVALGISLEDVKFFFGNIEQLKTKVKSGVIPIRNKRRLKEKNRLKFESSHQGIASITIPDEIIKKLPKESPSSEEAPKPESEETSKAEPKKVSNPESEEKPQEMPKESNDDASQEDETSTLIREENTEFNVDDITDYVEYEVDEDLDEIVAEAEEAEAVVDKPEPESEPEETMEPEPEPEPEPEETKEPEPEPEDFKEPEPTPEPKKPTHYGPKPPKVELFANYIEYAKQNARVIAQTELRQLQKEYPGKYPNWDQLQKAGFISYYLDLILNLPFNEPRQRTRVESQRAEDLKKGTVPRIADINKILSTDRSKTYDADEMTMGICWFEGKDLSAVGGEKTTTIKEVIEIKKGASKNVKKEVTPMKEESRIVNKQPEQVIVTNSTPIVSNSEANNTGVMVLNGVVKMVTYDVVTHTQITLPEGVEGITLTFPVTVTIKK